MPEEFDFEDAAACRQGPSSVPEALEVACQAATAVVVVAAGSVAAAAAAAGREVRGCRPTYPWLAADPH